MANQPEVPEDQAEAQALADAINAVGESDTAAELAAANDRLLRLQAEMQNLRNRTSREIADERKYAALPVLRDLLPVLDNINRAIEAAEKAGEVENLLEGFRLVGWIHGHVVKWDILAFHQPSEVIVIRHQGRDVAAQFPRAPAPGTRGTAVPAVGP